MTPSWLGGKQVYAGPREIIKDWIYNVTANGLSFVKNMFNKEVVIIHLPWIFGLNKAVDHSFSTIKTNVCFLFGLGTKQ